MHQGGGACATGSWGIHCALPESVGAGVLSSSLSHTMRLRSDAACCAAGRQVAETARLATAQQARGTPYPKPHRTLKDPFFGGMC